MTDTRPLALTGASGFLGRAVLEMSQREGIAVRALSRHPQPSTDGITWVQGNLKDRSAIEELIDGCSGVIHMGATLTGPAATVIESIVSGTRQIAEAARAAGVRLVHLSSLGVVDQAGLGTGAPHGDDTPLEPRPESRGAYSCGKVLAERTVNALVEQGLDATIVRPAQLVGDGLRSVPPSLGVPLGPCRFGLARSVTPIPVVHIRDVAEAIRLILQAAPAPRIVTLVDQRPVTRGELLAKLRQSDVPGSRKLSIPLGWLVQPLASWLDLRTDSGKYSRLVTAAHRVRAMESASHWQCRHATSLGWNPTSLDQWLSPE